MEIAGRLAPLQLFYDRKGLPLPHFKEIHGYEIPFPERQLLVHESDMTSRLEGFYGEKIRIERLQKKLQGDELEREVILRLKKYERPVEYGAIQIDLSKFNVSVRNTILESDTPFGGVLNSYHIPYKSVPQSFFSIQADRFLMDIFYLKEPHVLFGRCNRLTQTSGDILAEVVEMLPPMDFFLY